MFESIIFSLMIKLFNETSIETLIFIKRKCSIYIFFLLIQRYPGHIEVLQTSHVSILCPWRYRNINYPVAETRTLPNRFFLFAVYLYTHVSQAAYDVGGYRVNPHMIQSSILGLRPHFSPPVCNTRTLSLPLFGLLHSITCV